MTNELEKTFFDTFGIEPKCVKRTLKLAIHGYDENNLPEDLRQFISSQAQVYHVYPQITDHILLELICLYNYFQNDTSSYFIPFDYKNIKNNILTILVKEINDKDKNRYFDNDVYKLKQQVHTLFEEG